MGKNNSYKKKKKLARDKREEKLIIEQTAAKSVTEPEEYNPWKDLRRDNEEQRSGNSRPSNDNPYGYQYPYNSKVIRKRVFTQSSYDPKSRFLDEDEDNRDEAENRPKYLYDSARRPDNDGTGASVNAGAGSGANNATDNAAKAGTGNAAKAAPGNAAKAARGNAANAGAASDQGASKSDTATARDELTGVKKAGADASGKTSYAFASFKESGAGKFFGKVGAFFKRHAVPIIVIAAAVVLVLGFFGFKFLVKYGSFSYLHNYLNNTAGSLEYQTFPEAMAGADGETPKFVDETDPESFGVKEYLDMDVWPASGVYERNPQIDFGTEITQNSSVPGILTFRGNYRRDTSSVGKAGITDRKFDTDKWTFATGKLLKNNGSDYWSGNGWTGQPLLVSWSKEVRQNMNMYDFAKEKDNLTEVIYPGMDGRIHFLDLSTGEETRPVINVGMTFKGTASVYPGGIPLLFCGCGDAQTGPYGENVSQRFYIYSLIDGTLLYEDGYDDSFAPRTWHAYDSSPIIDAETDTLIYPGENGVIYTMNLNTQYNEETGWLKVSPSRRVKYSFTIPGRYGEDKRAWGSECSACAWKGYIFLGDNSGIFYCLDINTMKMVWVTDLGDDINSSPMLSFEDSGKYLYVGTTLKYGTNDNSTGEAAIYKINAITGQTVWKKPYEVHTVKGYAGGVLSTGALGMGVIDDYVLYSVSKTPSLESGYIVALNKATGHEDWRINLDTYSWSSGVLTYDRNGAPFLVQGCQNGDLLLIDVLNGKIVDTMNFGSAIEATPVMYGNRLIIATRSEKIIGLSVK